MTKIDVADLENSSKGWIYDNVYVDGNVKVINNCHITGKYEGSVHRDYDIKVK